MRTHFNLDWMGYGYGYYLGNERWIVKNDIISFSYFTLTMYNYLLQYVNDKYSQRWYPIRLIFYSCHSMIIIKNSTKYHFSFSRAAVCIKIRWIFLFSVWFYYSSWNGHRNVISIDSIQLNGNPHRNNVNKWISYVEFHVKQFNSKYIQHSDWYLLQENTFRYESEL